METLTFQSFTSKEQLQPGTLINIGNLQLMDDFIRHMAKLACGQDNFHIEPTHNMGRGVSNFSVADLIRKTAEGQKYYGSLLNPRAVILSTHPPEYLVPANIQSVHLCGLDILTATEKYILPSKILKRVLLICSDQDPELVYLTIKTITGKEIEEVEHNLDVREIQNLEESLKQIWPSRKLS